MILKNPVFSDNKILMEKGQEITSKSIERLENYKIGEVEILDGKEQELNKIQTEEKVIKEEFEKVYQETRVKAKEVFTNWFNKKHLDDFDNKPVLTQIFALCEWLKTQGYAISTKSNYYDSNYSAKISFNEGDINTQGHENLEKALVSAIELAVEDLNDRLEQVCY